MKTTIQRTLVALAALAGMCAPGIGLAQAGSAESRIGHWYIGGGFGVAPIYPIARSFRA